MRHRGRAVDRGKPAVPVPRSGSGSRGMRRIRAAHRTCRAVTHAPGGRGREDDVRRARDPAPRIHGKTEVCCRPDASSTSMLCTEVGDSDGGLTGEPRLRGRLPATPLPRAQHNQHLFATTLLTRNVTAGNFLGGHCRTTRRPSHAPGGARRRARQALSAPGQRASEALLALTMPRSRHGLVLGCHGVHRFHP